MKVTLNWLRQYADFDWSAEDLADRLTMLGLEVESVRTIPGEFQGIVIAQILSRDKVPGSDKLSVCRVNDGKTERTIICGAQNHKAGDKVPLILPGSALPLKPGETEPFVIKERKVFGITSQGMMCSPQELGLPDSVDGLLILPADVKVGQPFAEYLGRPGGDVLYDLEVTPNRPDWNSVIGIAREIAALTGNRLKIPELPAPDSPPPKAVPLVDVRLEDPLFCPRYTARVVQGVKIGPSPDWLRAILEKVGVRSINNVVDVTNYVMLESGQPLHAFDFGLLARDGSAGQKPAVIVRRATEGEKFTTLDGQERALTNEMLLIADGGKAVALAGIMGGRNTEIRDSTRDVLIESAYFKPSSIRRTSKALGLRSESSYRFERGSDIGICDWASRRCAQLIVETAGGRLHEGVVDAYPAPSEPARIPLRPWKANELLGLTLRPEECEYYLGQLGLKTLGRKPKSTDAENAGAEPVTFLIPSFRVDLKREVDLIEEIARLHGVEKIPAAPPRGAIGANAFDFVHDEIADARRTLAGMGLNETQGQTLISRREVRGPNQETAIALANPLSSDMDVLRPSLLPGLLAALRHNVSHKNYDVAIFEIGRVFRPTETLASPEGSAALHAGWAQSPAAAPGENRRCVEERRLAVALTGQREPLFWSGEERGAKFDIYDLKGMLEEFFEQFGIRGAVYGRQADTAGLFLDSASVRLGKLALGKFGILQPGLAKQYDLRDPVFLAELDFDLLLARRNSVKLFKPLAEFPPIRRDVAIVVSEDTAHESVLQVARQAKPANLESIALFDVFRGKNVPAGQKSMAYAFTYRNAERTLTDAEVNAAHEKIISALKEHLKAAVRE